MKVSEKKRNYGNCSFQIRGRGKSMNFAYSFLCSSRSFFSFDILSPRLDVFKNLWNFSIDFSPISTPWI